MGILPTTREGASLIETLSLKKAVKDYRDKYLSGLTDDEKKEIEAKLEEYRKQCAAAGMSEKEIRDAVDLYYKGLLKQYGAKFEAFLDNDSGSSDGVNPTETGTVANVADTTTTNATDTIDKSTKPITHTTKQTDADGTVYLLIATPNGSIKKIKLAENADTNDTSGGDDPFSFTKATQAYEDMSLITK